jgi:hypothetical protein
MKSLEYYIITAFNVNRGFDKTNKRNNLDYLEQRFEIFESVTIPSIKSQLDQDFKWLVFFDSDTPESFKQRAKEVLHFKNCLLIYVDGISDALAFLQTSIAPETKYLATTNLDNDDALHKNFTTLVKTIIKKVNYSQTYFINFPFGYMLRSDSLLMREFLSSPFHTIIEPVNDQMLTCLDVPHYKLYSLSSAGVFVYQAATAPVWLQLVHETNVKNRLDINAVQVSVANKLDDFGISSIPSCYEQVSHLNANKLYASLKLIRDQKKTFSFKVKLLAYTWFPYFAPLLLKFKLLFQAQIKQSKQLTSPEIRVMLSDLD